MGASALLDARGHPENRWHFTTVQTALRRALPEPASVTGQSEMTLKIPVVIVKFVMGVTNSCLGARVTAAHEPRSTSEKSGGPHCLAWSLWRRGPPGRPIYRVPSEAADSGKCLMYGHLCAASKKRNKGL